MYHHIPSLPSLGDNGFMVCVNGVRRLVENARALSEETNSKHGVPKLWKNGDGDIPKIRRFLGRETINTGALPLELLPP